MPWDQSSTVSGSGQRVRASRSTRSSRSGWGVAVGNGVTASDMGPPSGGTIMVDAPRAEPRSCGERQDADSDGATVTVAGPIELVEVERTTGQRRRIAGSQAVQHDRQVAAELHR